MLIAGTVAPSFGAVIATGSVAAGAGISGGSIAGALAAKAVHKVLIWKILTGVGVGLGGAAIIGVTIATGGAAEEIDSFENSCSFCAQNMDMENFLGISAIDDIL